MDLFKVNIYQFYKCVDWKSISCSGPCVVYNINKDIIFSHQAFLAEGFDCVDISIDNNKSLVFVKIDSKFIDQFKKSSLEQWRRFNQINMIRSIEQKTNLLKTDIYNLLQVNQYMNIEEFKESITKSLQQLLSYINCHEINLYLVKGDNLFLFSNIGVNTKKVILLNDLSKNETISCMSCLPYFINENGTQSLSLPIIDSKVSGVISFNQIEGNDLSDEMVGQLIDYTNTVGIVLQQGFQQIKLNKEIKYNNFLSNYISKFLVTEIKNQGTQNRFKPIKKNVVSLFADIRSFTSISERLSSQVLIDLLNIYFDEVTSVIESHHGTVDKLVGDMIMVKWNIPHDVENSKVHAVLAAIGMQKKMITKVVPHWKDAGIQMIGIGIGIDFGPAYVGNIGSKDFTNYTAFGDSVENAATLESIARPGQILITDSYYQTIKNEVPRPIKSLKGISLKGKGDDNKIQVFKPLEYPDYTS